MKRVIEKPMPWVERIMDAILRKDNMAARFGQPDYNGESDDEAASFDMDGDDGGYPTIHWVIAKFMLEGDADFFIVQNIQMYQGMIQRNIDDAIARLMEKGTPVYKIMEKGGNGRNIKCITLRPGYKDAKMATLERRQLLAERAVARAMDVVSKVCPEGLEVTRQKIESELSKSYLEAKNNQLAAAPVQGELLMGSDAFAAAM